MTGHRYHLRGRIVTSTSTYADGVVTVVGTRVASVLALDEWVRRYPEAGVPPMSGTILPGLVDIHTHGGGGHSFATTDAEQARAAAHHHHRHGSTTVLAGILTAPPAALVDQARVLGEIDEIDGIYCEGPFLAEARCGAHDPRFLLTPDPGLTRRILDAAGDAIRILTVAPELPGFADIRGMDVVMALGHSDADFDTFAAALAPRGPARLVTHLANCLPPLHHRNAGPVAAALAGAARDEITVELIADGVHLDAGFVRMVFAVAPTRVALVTDATAAAGMPDGTYDLGPQRVTVRAGVARLANGALAGGTSHLVDIVARVVREYGVDLTDAVRAATTTPAAVAGLHGAGELVTGGRADLLIVDDELRPSRVLRCGRWL